MTSAQWNSCMGHNLPHITFYPNNKSLNSRRNERKCGSLPQRTFVFPVRTNSASTTLSTKTFCFLMRANSAPTTILTKVLHLPMRTKPAPTTPFTDLFGLPMGTPCTPTIMLHDHISAFRADKPPSHHTHGKRR